MLPVLIRYAVLSGITTETEVARVGVVYAALIGIFVYRQFEWRRVFSLLTKTAPLSGAILLIIGAASVIAWALIGIETSGGNECQAPVVDDVHMLWSSFGSLCGDLVLCQELHGLRVE